MKKILFICTGNICRSPTAEAIARHKAQQKNLADKFIFDSAGIEGFHSGEAPDARSIAVGKKRGVSFSQIAARKIKNSDFVNFDLLLAMDRSHYSRLLQIAPTQFKEKIKLFLPFCEPSNFMGEEVIDPYYKDEDAFEKVFSAIDSALDNFFKNLAK